MSRTRTGHGPADWSDNEPSSALVRHGGYGSEPVETVGHMRPVVTPGGNFLENRNRMKPNNPFSIVRAARHPSTWRQTQLAEASKRYRERNG